MRIKKEDDKDNEKPKHNSDQWHQLGKGDDTALLVELDSLYGKIEECNSDIYASCPKTWVILCDHMLNNPSLGCLFSPYWCSPIPLHVHQKATDISKQWFPKPPHEPPDPILVVEVAIKDITWMRDLIWFV